MVQRVWRGFCVSWCIWYKREGSGPRITSGKTLEGPSGWSPQVQRGLKTAPKDAENGDLCTGILHLIDNPQVEHRPSVGLGIKIVSLTLLLLSLNSTQPNLEDSHFRQ